MNGRALVVRMVTGILWAAFTLALIAALVGGLLLMIAWMMEHT